MDIAPTRLFDYSDEGDPIGRTLYIHVTLVKHKSCSIFLYTLNMSSSQCLLYICQDQVSNRGSRVGPLSVLLLFIQPLPQPLRNESLDLDLEGFLPILARFSLHDKLVCRGI